MGNDKAHSTEERYDPPKVEQDIINFWEENNIFEKVLELRKGGKKFVFLEGPPTANGLPHPGHVLTRTMKDVILRYKTMNGYYIERKAGWDTHGLPVEIEVEKSLGLKNKQEIEEYGIKRFNDECKKSVFRYEEAWKEMTKRIGFWIDMGNPYITLKNDYIESVWWSLKKAWEKGLLSRGYRVTPYCPRCGTTLSSHEVAQGYREVTDPSIFIKFRVEGKDGYFLVWTTTPWTLISNVALAVNPDEWYIKIEYEGEKLILSEERAEVLLKGEEYKILDGWKGEELIGMKYEPLYRYANPDKDCWRVIGADFVSMDEGTGIVHIAPAFGEEDYEVGQKYDLPVVQLVRQDGTFPPEVEKWAGMFVKDADESIIEDLRSRELLMSVQKYTHQYPFCWRCDSPLIYYAIESWFIKMSELREQIVKNNEKISWHPGYLKHGRFGEFIKDVRDWSLSRERYWGTPLPIWECKKCGNEICVGSVEELRNLSENFPEEYDLHRPFVDKLEVKCPECEEKMKREEGVIDAWYDSGSAFFAQWHYPFENQEKFRDNFPADFICEAIDQTRGWFYSLLAVSTLNFDDISYKKILSLGHILDKEGQKMSKKARNYIEPNEIFNREGADAMRWYLVSASAPWSPKRFYQQVVRDSLGKFLMTVWNIYSFYFTYSSLDNFDYKTKKVAFEKRGLLDKWILSRLHNLIRDVTEKIENFELHKAARDIEDFVIKDVSNWYIRNSRKRFWLEEETVDKLAGYSTIYELLMTLSKLIAPFVPFISEKIYHSIGEGESVHLCDYPVCHEEVIDEELERKMDKVREITELARSLRAKEGIKLRYPLPRAVIVTSDDISGLSDILRDEINVKKVEFSDSIAPFVEKAVRPNYSSLGPEFKDKASYVASIIKKTPPDKIENMKVEVDGKEYILGREDYLLEEKEKEGFAVGGSNKDSVILDTRQTPELIAEGFSREIVRRIQEMRKDMNMNMEDRIVSVIGISEGRVKGWKEYIKKETRSQNLIFGNVSGDMVKEWNIDGEKISIGIKRL
ncbi:MAG: isoleucine--tRNA ligase [Candidatus Thermoplasmatota archaeon]|nr:isoleucine--tRNA ligase [Candidatus Thermoplasmatota archaeon]